MDAMGQQVCPRKLVAKGDDSFILGRPILKGLELLVSGRVPFPPVIHATVDVKNLAKQLIGSLSQGVAGFQPSIGGRRHI